MKKFLLLCLLSFSVGAQTEIFLSDGWKKISPGEIGSIIRDYDVILLGEEHNDEKGHAEKLKLISLLHGQGIKFSLGLEMMTRDKQTTIDEYMDGLISRTAFLQEIQPNNIKPYLNIVDYAQKEGIRLIATNTPRKYANIVSRNGPEALAGLSPEAKRQLPPLHSIMQYRNALYDKKLEAAFGHHGHEMNKDRMLAAMYLWDTSMASSIAETIPFKKQKFIHINGRYHSDEGYGITWRLKSMGFRVLTISMFPAATTGMADKKFGDIIYYTDIIRK